MEATMETRKRALANTQANEFDVRETSHPGQSSRVKSQTQMVEIPENLQHLTYGTTMSTISDLVSKVPNTQIFWSPELSAVVKDWAKKKQFTKTRLPTSDDLFELLGMPILNSLTSPEGWAISGWRTIDTIVLSRVLAKIERSLSTPANSFTWPKRVKDNIVEQALKTIADYGTFGEGDVEAAAGYEDGKESTKQVSEADEASVEGSEGFGVSQLGSILSPIEPTPEQRSAHERSLLPSINLDTDGFSSARFWPKTSGVPVAKVELNEKVAKPDDEPAQRPRRRQSLSVPRLKTPLPKPKPGQESRAQPASAIEKPSPQPDKPTVPPKEFVPGRQEKAKPSTALAMWWGRAKNLKAAAPEGNTPSAPQVRPPTVQSGDPLASERITTSTNAPLRNFVSRIPKPSTGPIRAPYTNNLFDSQVPSQSTQQERQIQPQVSREFLQAHRAPDPVPTFARRCSMYGQYLEIPGMSWVMAAEASEMTDWQLEEHYRALQDLTAELQMLEKRAEQALL